MRALALGLIVVSAGLFAACNRTPEEPMRAAAMSASTTPFSTSTPTSTPTPAKACPPDPEPNQPTHRLVTLTLPDAPRATKLEAEVVAGDHDTSRGLMFRTSMPEDHGMLFQLDRSEHSFWMHNTCISLDLLFIDDGRIVGIVESAPPLNDAPRAVAGESSMVLETNAGWCQRHGVRAGQRVVMGTLTK